MFRGALKGFGGNLGTMAQEHCTAGYRPSPRLLPPRTAQPSPEGDTSATSSHLAEEGGRCRAQPEAHLALELLGLTDVVLVAGLHPCLHRHDLPLTGHQLLLQLALHSHCLGPLSCQLLPRKDILS